MLALSPEQSRQSDAFIQDILATTTPGQRLYMIVDGARDEAIYPMFKKEADVYFSLYDNEVPETLRAAGPILYQVKQGDALSQWLITHYREKNGFILFASLGLTMIDIRRHFKRLAIVKSDAGDVFYFRYYDPRVLRTYLKSIDESDRHRLFGPFPCFWMQASSQGEYLQYDHLGQCSVLSLLSATPAYN